MESKENNQMQILGKENNQQDKSKQKSNGNRSEYIKGFDTRLKRCWSDIETLKSKNGSDSAKKSGILELDKKCQALNKKFEDLKNADEGHFEEIKNNFETESEELLRSCEKAVSSK